MQDHPAAFQPFLPELREFTEYNHHKIMFPILQILARGLELPEETFLDMHGFEDDSATDVRFMNYPHSENDGQKARTVWLKGHTDIGTLTILWSQSVSALQILCPDGNLPFVQVVNIGDSMEFLSGGFYKGIVHRVRQPPADQQGYDRLGVIYFVLEKVGVALRFDSDKAPTSDEYRKGCTAAYGLSQLTKKDDVVEEQIMHGVPVLHYN
ncbi:hypothetical protein BC628DRAFT_1423870 [Trametes gibbosa]|nr:hypothetical protein BC628DRAFT_1423870 [Trametes gibbosa]